MNDTPNGSQLRETNIDDSENDPDICAGMGQDTELSVDCVRDSGDWSEFESVEDIVSDVCKVLRNGPLNWPAASCEATLVLSDDARVQALNVQYRGIDKPTNVLSFPAPEMPHGLVGAEHRFLGDLIVASQTLLREAREQTIPARNHLAHLIVHGVLHLIGYDHETDAEATEMEQLETSLLAELGIADPYSEPSINSLEEAVQAPVR